jgi:glutamate-ammonia-ligase adenylyltransferase
VTEDEIRAALAPLVPAPAARELAIHAARLPDPGEALGDLQRLVVAAGRPDPRRLHAFLVLASHSPYLADWCIRRPDFLEALPARLAPGAPRTREDLHEELARFRALNTGAGLSAALRLFRHREYLRIALADFTGTADLAGTTRSLSMLADVLLERAVREARGPLESRFGRPTSRDEQGHLEEAGFAIVALGKLGGEELNYSSDIDLLYLFSRDGETTGGGPGGVITNREFFTHLGAEVTRLIGGQGPEGQVFRVDLGLRPGGKDGELVVSVRAAIAYYRSWAEPWERQALIKARAAAGDAALGRRFVDATRPLVYPAEPDPYLTLEIAAMKDRIDETLRASGRTTSDIKLGRGGIRELEFAIQALQLQHGGHDPWVRQPNTLLALHRLADKGYLTTAEYAGLLQACVFLRHVEHRLQLGSARRTAVLPERPAELARLARRMPPEAATGGEAPPFAEVLERHREAVRRFYDSVLGGASQTALGAGGPDLWFDRVDEPELRQRLAAAGIADPDAALRPLRMIRRALRPAAGVDDLRRALRRSGPALLLAAGRAVSPPRAFVNLEKLLSVLAADTSDLVRFLTHRELLEPTLRLLGRSDLLAALFIRQPEILKVLDERARLVRTPAAAETRTRLLEAARGPGETRLRAGVLRRRHREELAILAIRDINRQATLREVLKGLSDLADGTLDAALDLAGGAAAPVAVLGLGRLGYREIDYGSDLDLVFLHEGSGPDAAAARAAAAPLCERVIRLLTTLSRDGQLYNVDLRLRPSGREGDITSSPEALRGYLASEAEVWEMQSFLKARPAAGDASLGGRAVRDIEAVILERCRGLGVAAVREAVAAMRRRLLAESAADPGRRDTVKWGRGGIIEIHFVIEFLQLAHGVPSPPDKDAPRLLTHLHAAGRLDAASLRELYAAYLFFREVDHQMRLIHDRPLRRLPEEDARLAEVAAGLEGAPAGGAERAGWLRQAVADHGSAVRRHYEAIVGE